MRSLISESETFYILMNAFFAYAAIKNQPVKGVICACYLYCFHAQ